MLLVKRHFIQQHNNASPLTAHLTLRKTEKFGQKVLPHTPYSPDMAPQDYHLLRPLKYRGLSTMKMMRQSIKPCSHGCEILKETSQQHIQACAVLARMPGSFWGFCGIVLGHLW
jgi:hypothetical protein